MDARSNLISSFIYFNNIYEDSILTTNKLTIVRFFRVIKPAFNLKIVFFKCLDKIIILQRKFREYLEIKLKIFLDIIEKWKNVAGELYNQYKLNKTKNSMELARKIIKIKDADRDEIIRKEMYVYKRRFLKKYASWIKYCQLNVF